jgi:hypothetical protein
LNRLLTKAEDEARKLRDDYISVEARAAGGPGRPRRRRPAEFWAPLTMGTRFDAAPDVFGPERPRSVSIVGRLKAGFGVRQAQAAPRTSAEYRWFQPLVRPRRISRRGAPRALIR